MLSVIEDELVKKRQWIDSAEYFDMVVLSQTAPGILAMNISILVGKKLGGGAGAIVAALGAGLPSFVIILVIAIFLNRFQENPYVVKIFCALRPAVVALIAVPVFKMARTAQITLTNAWIPVVTALLIWLLGVSPIYIIIAAFALGAMKMVYGKRHKKQ